MDGSDVDDGRHNYELCIVEIAFTRLGDFPNAQLKAAGTHTHAAKKRVRPLSQHVTSSLDRQPGPAMRDFMG